MDLTQLWASEDQGTGGTSGGGGEGGGRGDLWEEIIHQLTARSAIRDFEKMAEKESDIEHGEGFHQCSSILGLRRSQGVQGFVSALIS